MNWIPATTPPTPYTQVLLALAGDDYTVGHWSEPGKGRWIGHSLNQSPPYYRIETGSVTHWTAIEPPEEEQE